MTAPLVAIIVLLDIAALLAVALYAIERRNRAIRIQENAHDQGLYE
jgi:hypothetical protein